ncbi:Sodium/sulfate symporter [Auriculariales sp. MPI-PUGE-AT-0066]|nr:Sodium/sulfate symporter [Auriculariales sp. MPI-PUGE-AT-0066]
MKFSASLKFNANPEWWDHYIAYENLKKTIYQLEKQHFNKQTPEQLEGGEATALLHGEGDSDSQNTFFVSLLDKELAKIISFYEGQRDHLFQELIALERDVERMEHDHNPLDDPYRGQRRELSTDDDDEDEDDDVDSSLRDLSPDVLVNGRRRSSTAERHITFGEPVSSRADGQGSSNRRRMSVSETTPSHLGDSVLSDRQRSRSMASRARESVRGLFGLASEFTGPLTIWTANTDYATDTRSLFKRRITNCFIGFSSFKSYVELNRSGFRKILKKYDKTTEHTLQQHYMENVVDTAKPFLPDSRHELDDGLEKLKELYAKCVTGGDKDIAERQLRSHQREHVVWERDTVWRRMIGRERRGANDDGPKAITPGDSQAEQPIATLPTPVGRLHITRSRLSLFVALVVFIVLAAFPVLDNLEASRCFAILILASTLWATECIPLFVTSMAIPFLTVTLRVFRDSAGKPLSPPDGTKYVFSQMFSPTIMLLIGGFTIASALSKTNIDRVLITRLLSLAGTSANAVLLAFMAVACFASMWISNVAAPTLCFTLVRPILRTIPAKSSFGPAVILGIALAANIGGQSSPISSPQNLIALQAMEVPLDWLEWFAVAIPVSFISIMLIWLLLLAAYRPSVAADGDTLIIRPIRVPKERFTGKQWFVTAVCIGTIALWCVEHQIEGWVGDMGIIALIPIVLFFSTGVLKKEDFDQFLWTIVFLAMGGIALGKAVTSSGLLDYMDGGIRRFVDGMSIYAVVLALSAVVLVISTFISHTIASVLLVPIASEVGQNLPGNHARLLIFLTGLLCSTGMGMPVSGFPNQTAANQEDELGELYLTNVDFLKNGVPASIIAALVVATVGFALSKLVGV